jgi:hypothetical protein
MKTLLLLVLVTSHGVALRWTVVPQPLGAAPISYQHLYRSDAACYDTSPVHRWLLPSLTTYLDTGLVHGTTYHYWIVNHTTTNKNSPPSTCFTVTYP